MVVRVALQDLLYSVQSAIAACAGRGKGRGVADYLASIDLNAATRICRFGPIANARFDVFAKQVCKAMQWQQWVVYDNCTGGDAQASQPEGW